MKKIILILLIIFFSPIITLLIVLSPIIKIRFYPLVTNRIGHLVEDINIILSKKKIEDKNTVDIFFLKYKEISNNFFYQTYIQKNFIILPKFLIYPFHFIFLNLSNKFKYFENFLIHKRIFKKSGYNFINEYHKNFRIPKSLSIEGDDFLKKLNIQNKDIVCINIWNTAHLKNQNFLHHSHRFSNFDSYLLAIKYLISLGYVVIKVGRSEDEVKLNDDNFIDYSFNYSSEKLDIFLINKCKFYISNSTGLDHLAFSFNKPMLINTPTINDYFVEKKNILYLLRPYFSKKLNREININEIINEELTFKLKSKYFDDKEVIIKDNSNYEILNACKDLIFLMDNDFKINKDDFNLSNRFWEAYLKAKKIHKNDIEYYKNIKSYYSWTCLKNKPDILE